MGATLPQEALLLRLAATRDLLPGVLTTRVERIQALRALLPELSEGDARVLIGELRRRPLATPNAIERTPYFAQLRAKQLREMGVQI